MLWFGYDLTSLPPQKIHMMEPGSQFGNIEMVESSRGGAYWEVIKSWGLLLVSGLINAIS